MQPKPDAGAKRVDLVGLGLLIEHLLQICQTFGLLAREIGSLREVLGEVIKLPLVLS